MLLKYYLNKLDYENMPEFIKIYLTVPSLVRLKKVGYFCGMDYASKDIYNFTEYISRFDHSLTVALLTYKLTKDKTATLAALFHDIATPCFSHVIDYMNKDYENQESTEEYTEKILRNDKTLCNFFKEDNIDIDNVISFKRHTIVDNDRPKLCADRLDGVILTGIGWTKNINIEDINNIIDDLCIIKNEFNEYEIGFKTKKIALKVLSVSESIDRFCHSDEDNYMMELLAKITKYAILKKYISYDDLYHFNEEELFALLKNKKDFELAILIYEFENKKLTDISKTNLISVKARKLNPIVNGNRIK